MQSIQSMDINIPFDFAFQFVMNTSQSVFVTGKAGTGKTTFLKKLTGTSIKKIAVAAPTGVAAINAGGVTLHSLFQLPFGGFLPEKNANIFRDRGFSDQRSLFASAHLNATKIELLNDLEVLIIDEVSMVRADMLDAIDTILRHHRKNESPFGGLQMVFIGDLYQLPPVVKNDEWPILNLYYKSPFFFESLAVKALKPVTIELTKIYRQKEEKFIDTLNRVRNNQITKEDLEYLNGYYKPAYKPLHDEAYITLTTHNEKAEVINRVQLAQLKVEEKKYSAIVNGEFGERSFPVEQNLKLKVGAQVMFIKNDKGEHRRFYNGMLAIVSELEDDKIKLKPVSGADELTVDREVWKNIRYKSDKENDRIEEEELGTFKQFPLRLAWAITIHKSQGLTFDKAIIDAGDSFAAGQVYVALSRLTTTKDLILYSKITDDSIHVDERIISYFNQILSVDELSSLLQLQQKKYLAQSLKDAFRFGELGIEIDEIGRYAQEQKIVAREEMKEFWDQLRSAINYLESVGTKFVQIDLEVKILPLVEREGYEILQSRITKAVDFFNSKLKTEIFDPLLEHIQEMKSRKRVKKYLKELQLLAKLIKRQKYKLEQAKFYADGLNSGKDVALLLAEKFAVNDDEKNLQEEKVLEINKPKKGETSRISLEMFLEGKSIEEIASYRGFVSSTIENHLASFISTGEIKIENLVDNNTIEKITTAIDSIGLLSPMAIRNHLNQEVSYSQVRAVLEHYRMKINQN